MPEIRLGLDSLVSNVRRDFRFVLATFAASGIGYLGSAAAPVIVQALIEAGLDHHHAGDLGTIELLTLAISSLLITPYVAIVSHRRIAVSGTVMAICGLVISALSIDYATMIAGRIATGAGSGLAISGANAAVAAREDAERIFAIIWTMGGAITASLAMQLPGVVEGGKYGVGFGVLLALAVVGLPCIFWLPPRPAAVVVDLEGGSGGVVLDAPGGSNTGFWNAFGLLPLLALGGIFLYSAAEQALWNFAYNIPIESGVDPTIAAQILAFTTLMGLGGGAIAALVGVRFGRIFPIVLGSLLSIAGRWLYISASSPLTLLAGSLLWGVGFYFVSPYQIGLVAAIDRKGRIAVIGAAALNFGYAFGPGIAGRILEYMDRDWLMLLIAASTAASMLLMLPLAIRVDRSARREGRVPRDTA